MSRSRQYMSIIFYHDEDQKRLALESKQREEASIGSPIFTEIVPISDFYLAEDYHQKYYLRREPEFMKELSIIYPNAEDFIASTAAARLNGYAGGYGAFDNLKEARYSLGLSEAGASRLLELADRGLQPGCAAS